MSQTTSDYPAPGAVPEREIVSSRLLNFPRELVFEAFTDPTRLAQWWGPNGFTNTFHVFEPKTGSAWRFIMHGPDGKDYPNESTFVEVVKPERIVFNHDCDPHFRMHITFEDKGGKTQFAFRMIFETAALCEGLRAICEPSNEENFDRLEAVLSKIPAA